VIEFLTCTPASGISRFIMGLNSMRLKILTQLTYFMVCPN